MQYLGMQTPPLLVVVAVHPRDYDVEANLRKDKQQPKAVSNSVWGDVETLFVIMTLDSFLYMGDQVFGSTP